MKTTVRVFLMGCILPLSVLVRAQSNSPSKTITMDEEPHHHIVLHNDEVNVLKIEVAPGDSIVLHRHNHDALAIAIGDQEVAVGVPGKPDVHQKNADGQLRLQRLGYVHSTHVVGPAAYHTIAVEFLHPQQNLRNLCAQVIPAEPLHCSKSSSVSPSAKSVDEQQFESDQTRVQLVRVLPHQSVDVGRSRDFQLIVVLDRVSISPVSGKGPDKTLRPGDFVWLDAAGPSRVLKNGENKQARFVEINFNPSSASHQLLSTPGKSRLLGNFVSVETPAIPIRANQAHSE